MAKNDYLDGQIKHAVYLLRYSEGLAHKLIAKMNDLDRAFIKELRSNELWLSEFEKGRLTGIIKGLKEANKAAHETVGLAYKNEALDFVDYEAAWAAKHFKESMGLAHFGGIATSQIAAIVSSSKFVGAIPYGSIDEHLKELFDSKFRVSKSILERGFIQGLNEHDIAKQLMGTAKFNYSNGAFERYRRTLKAFVRTATTKLANEAKDAVAMQDADLYVGRQWSSVLDSRTSPICRANSNKIYPLEEGWRLPAHVNCRSVWIYVPKDERYRVDSPSYNEWLERQPKAVQDDILGVDRANAFRDGVHVDKFIDKSGKTLTLKELRALDVVPERSVTEQYLGSHSYRAHRSNMFKEYQKRGIDYAKQGLSESQAVALWAYTDDLYKPLNQALRDGTANKQMLAVRDELNAALDKMPKYKGIVYRGTELSKKQIDVIIKKKLFNDKAFISATNLKMQRFDGNVYFEVISQNGRDISKLSKFSSEAEVLFKAASDFEIVDINKVESILEVTMKEVE